MTELESWDNWLTSPDCQPVLEGAARFIYRMAARVGLPGDLLPCRDPWSLPGEERDACFQTLGHELWLFLRSRSAEWVRRMGGSPATGLDPRHLMLRLGQEFFGHLRDQARTLDLDPKRALYRRIRQVLYEEPSIAYRATPDGAFYAVDPHARWPGSWQALRSEPYGSWESPLDLVGVRDLSRRAAIIELARFFWHSAAKRLGQSCFLPVRELTHFISCHYPGLSGVETLPLRTSGVSGEDEAGAAGEPASTAAGPDLAFMAARIPSLAEQLVNGWTHKQRSAFALIQGEGLGLREAAGSLGYKTPSGAAYVYKSVCDSLRDFCLLWPGLSPPDLDSRLFESFVLEVVQFCKKAG